MKNFHVADTTRNPPREDPHHDELAHVRPITEPHKEVSIDEAMVGFSVRFGFKQYVPMKPTKRGIKVWVRADLHNGYIGDFQVYTGRQSNNPVVNLGGRVVLDLMRPLINLGHHVYTNSFFFTSPDLFLQLWGGAVYVWLLDGSVQPQWLIITNRSGQD